MKSYFFSLTLLLGFGAFLQTVQAQTELDNLNPEEYFNFWLGEWELTWEDADGNTAHGQTWQLRW